jgi:polysaccharide biosynthesis protein PslH
LNKWWWKILWRYERWTHRNAAYNFFIHADDLAYAIREFGLEKDKCLVVTYGISIKEPPSKEEAKAAAEFIRQKHSVAEEEKILLFSGSFNYQPNLDALKIIEEKLCPLWDNEGFKYKVVVCGPWLDPSYIQHPHILITGFVDSIEPYFTGADVFINPVMDGGGIKTKLVEALGYNCNTVSTLQGATGVDPALTNHKLFLAEDGNWASFAQKTIEAAALEATITNEFYQHFYWGYSTKKAAEFIG